jgi:hypothetical protein
MCCISVLVFDTLCVFAQHAAIMAVPISHSSRKIIEEEFTSDEISALIFTKAIQEVKRFVECNQFPRCGHVPFFH